MAGKHSSPSHARPSSGRSSYRGGRSVRRDSESEITDIRNEYAERRRERTRESVYSENEYPAQTRERQRYYPEQRNDRSRRGNSDRVGQTEQYSKKESPVPAAIKDTLGIIALSGMILLVFAFFHHVKDRVFLPDPIPVAPVQTSAVPDEAVTSEPPRETEQPAETQEPTEVPEQEEDNRTPWQKKFEAKFTQDVISTENSYSSPNVSITIDTYSEDVNGKHQVWYVADIYVADIDCLKTYFARDTYIPGGCLDEPIESMCSATGALIAVSGDYCSNQKNGFLVRNGQVIHDEQTLADICVLFQDGTVETYAPDAYVPEEVIARNPWQSWKFGPRLLDENGQAMTSFNSGAAVINENAARCGFGYYEPGHYCLVVNDGRQEHSSGFLLSEFAELFEKMGCTCAYNLDGGATAVMAFNGEKFSRPQVKGSRNPGDIFFLCDSLYSKEEEVQ